MARGRKPKQSGNAEIHDFRHDNATRKNNPPAGLAATYETRERETRTYAYDPHLDPQLQWAGKAEHTSFEVDVVSLHIHERISTKAILDAVRRPEPVQPDLFGSTPLPADKEVEFYQHEVGWTNRLILGGSLLVMNSLLVKEGMAGKVQMIYIAPPYGIKYASNFQPRIDRRDVKDKDEDLTREPEQIKAYRDTWKLGIHSYLTYLRDRLLLARELLTESGSIFVQINDENLHLVRSLLDEVFGRENFVAVIVFRTRSTSTTIYLPVLNDYLLFYAKDKTKLKFRQLFVDKPIDERFSYVETSGGEVRTATFEDRARWSKQADYRLFSSSSLSSTTGGEGSRMPFRLGSMEYYPAQARGWRCSLEGLRRLAEAERIMPHVRSIRYKFFYSDFPVAELGNLWEEQLSEQDKAYAVQTNTKVVDRCILMTTDPGDLVFDPTCGSGTTAYCAEKWGRRWITCDTSRVALAIARQRLMTAKFDYYELRDPERGPAGGFIYETVPHITLESIAKNAEIDAIAAKYQPEIDQALNALNRALDKDWKEWEVPREIPHPIWSKEAQQAYHELLTLKGKAIAVDAEQVRDLLQTFYRQTGHLWKGVGDVPDPVPPPDWPNEAKAALRTFWELKRKKRQEIDESIARNAPQETLYDRPQVKRGVVRVSGPFTVEAIPVPAVEDPTESPIPPFEAQEAAPRTLERSNDHLTTLINLLKQQGSILFPNGKRMEIRNLRALHLGHLHAEAETEQQGETRRVAFSFGPMYGPITAFQVNEAIPTAKLNAYQMLIFAGFSIDPSAQEMLQKTPVEGIEVHFANIAPDVLVGDLLKTNRASQIFTVFGQPDIAVEKQPDDTYIVRLRGVDIYDPVTGKVDSKRGDEVAAWFLDTDYDGKTFKIAQAFFPSDSGAWDKIRRALKAEIPDEVFDQMHSTESFPFKAGAHRRVAVKVIDFRGNEVIRVWALDGELYR